ncbi:helix-turn-helix transcriptional regulator [Microbacterium sp. ARD31]|uniref:helix-turn-helix transcriptional regulator n=1 Tax=Microbacterium sp. ARD31 TaxID=2962576 RepID=UPI002881FCF8|nr:helix-turn-helix transcriptional regulator [Microbacterium sp. ARD31]MDT0188059.1 helix-turn-helix transcriptional regulator [Microbacterium sp. ARD31]
MPDLVLTETEQRALRHLLAAEPRPGSPLPAREVLERLTELIPADGVEAVYQDGTYAVTHAICLGDNGDEEVDLPEPGDGPHYLGIMHWRANPLAAQKCFGGLVGDSDGLCIGFRNGADGLVQIGLGRWHGPFVERDIAVLRMLAPLLARLSRERLTPSLPVSLTTQERRVLSHVAAGRSNAEIAQALFVAPSTVRKHLEHSYRKLGVTSRVAAVARLQGRDLPDLDLRERLERLHASG